MVLERSYQNRDFRCPDFRSGASVPEFWRRSLPFTQDMCSVSIEEIDSSTTSFVVRDIHRRDLDVVTQTIKRELKRPF